MRKFEPREFNVGRWIFVIGLAGRNTLWFENCKDRIRLSMTVGAMLGMMLVSVTAILEKI